MYAQEILLPSLVKRGNTNYIWDDAIIQQFSRIAQIFGDEEKQMKVHYLMKVIGENYKSFDKKVHEVNQAAKDIILGWYSTASPDGLYDRPLRLLLRGLLVHNTGTYTYTYEINYVKVKPILFT